MYCVCMKEESFSKLCSIWNRIGPFNMDSFSDRLILQKKVFLLKEGGFDIGYGFNKYIRGPYSPVLANDGYKINSGEIVSGNAPLSEEIIKKLHNIEKGHEGEALWFELVTSILYCIKKEGLSIKECKEKLIEEKPHLDMDEFDEAIKKLSENSFI